MTGKQNLCKGNEQGSLALAVVSSHSTNEVPGSTAIYTVENLL